MPSPPRPVVRPLSQWRVGWLMSLVVLLSYAEARSSNWRPDLVQCSFVNYAPNATRVTHFCGETPLFFCCHYENPLTSSKCCALDELQHEHSALFYLAHALCWLALALLLLIALGCFYILLKSKKLLKHTFSSD